MALLSKILPLLWVLDVALDDASHTIAAWRCRTDREAERAEYDTAALARGIVAVTVSGRGVVAKPVSSELAARVRGDAETFLATESAGRIGFVRRERLQPLLDELAAAAIRPQRLFVATSPEEAARETLAALRWRQLVRPTNEGSALAQAVARRTGLPVLGLLLLLLSANAAVSPSLNARRQTLQTALAARTRSGSEAAATDARQRALRLEFSAAATNRALLCDRIGAAVPEHVALTALEVEPLTRRFEAHKPLERRRDAVVVRGTAPDAGAVSVFVERLAAEPAWRTVRLAAVERTRDAEELSFSIEIIP